MKNNKLIRNLISFLLFIAIIVIFLLVFRNIDNKDNTVNNYYEYSGKKYSENSDIETILFVGLDSYENVKEESYRNNSLADCLVLLVIDNNNNTVLPIQINRDTMCNYYLIGLGGSIVGSGYGQISLSHSYGNGDIASLINTKDAVSDLMGGINIDYYVSLPMDAVGKINDLVGGVEVFVEDDFSNIDSSIEKDKTILLNGNQALNFVRSRSGMLDSSNIARMNRQRVYLRALYDKGSALLKNDDSFAFNALNSINDYIICNTNIRGLADLVNTLIEDELLESISIKGEAIKGETYMEYHLDEAWLKDFCIKTFYREVK